MSVCVEDLLGCAAAHEVAVVGAAGVVGDEPGVDLGAELGEAVEASPVERGTPAFLERGALESFADRVVVGGAGRGAVMGDAELGEMAGERLAGELGAVVGEHAADVDAETAKLADHPVEEPVAMSVLDGP